MKAFRFAQILSFLLFVNSSLISQTDTASFVFPLEIGDMWRYSVSNEWYPGHHYYGEATLKIAADTVMPNGKRYIQMPPMSAFLYTDTIKYLRKDSSKVYQYLPKDSSEFLRFDFSAKIGDTITVFSTNPFKGIILRDTGTYRFLGKYNFKMFDFGDLVADSLGIVNHGNPDLTIWSLIGAKVNGRFYGTILYVNNQRREIPIYYHLYQNYPNPFNPTTTISFDLPKSDMVRLSIYDCLGRELSTLINGYEVAGHQEIEFDANKIPSGIYFYRIISGDYSATRKMLLLK